MIVHYHLYQSSLVCCVTHQQCRDCLRKTQCQIKQNFRIYGTDIPATKIMTWRYQQIQETGYIDIKNFPGAQEHQMKTWNPYASLAYKSPKKVIQPDDVSYLESQKSLFKMFLTKVYSYMHTKFTLSTISNMQIVVPRHE